MMIKNKLILFVLLGITGLTACKKDDDKVQNATQLPATEAKVESQKMDTDLSKDIIDMFNAEGINAVYSLSDLMISDDIFSHAKTRNGSNPKALLKSKGRDFRKIFVPQNSLSNGKISDHEPFDFHGNLGVYEWNASTESFDKTDVVSSSIIINFPLENSSTNNVSFILSNYSEVKIIDNHEYSSEYYLPTKIVAEVKIDNVKKAGLNYEVAYSSKGNPTSASIDLLVTPFTYTFVYSSTGATSSKIITSIKKETELLFDTAYNLTFSDTEKNVLAHVNGYSAYKEYKIQGSIDVTELNKLDDDGDINPFVKLELYKNTAKVGDIVFVNVTVTDDYNYSYTERVAYVKYADASKEKVEIIFASTIEEWENYLMELERG